MGLLAPGFVTVPALLHRDSTKRALASCRPCGVGTSHGRCLVMVAGGPEEPASKVTPDIEEEEYPSYAPIELDTEVMKEQALRAVEDVGTRPGFYGKIVAYGLGGVISVTVLKAVVAAVDSLPVLPGVLELIGLGYCAWFGWRYVIFKSSREELLEEIDDLLGRTTGRLKE